MNPDVETLKKAGRRLGFHRVGVAEAGPSPHRERFLEWLSAGHHGSMDYMAREVARRVDPRETLPGARSVVVVTFPYDDTASFPPTDGPRGKIARYARGRDYHKVMPPLLKELAAVIRDGDRWQTWFAVDTAPILERDWAEQAGVGWIGKNALVIDPEVGSWFFLGLVVTDRVYPPDPPTTDHCGTCRACLDVCPTDAFPAPRTVDARRCISYLTIEHRGEIDETLESQLHGWVFGCDLCQEVCPYNSRSGRVSPAVHPDLRPRELPDDLEALSRITREEFIESFAGTAITRTGHEGLGRNARLNIPKLPKDPP